MLFRTSTFRNPMAAWAAIAMLLAALALSPAVAVAEPDHSQRGKPAFVPGSTVGHAARNVNHRNDHNGPRGRQDRRARWIMATPGQPRPPRAEPWRQRVPRQGPPPQARPEPRRDRPAPPPRADSGSRDNHEYTRHDRRRYDRDRPRHRPDPRRRDRREYTRHDRRRYDHDRPRHRPDPRRHHRRDHFRREKPRHYGPGWHGYRPHPRHRHRRHYRPHRPPFPRYWWRYYYNSYLAPYPIYVLPYRVVRTVPVPAYHAPGVDGGAYCGDGVPAGGQYAGASRQTGGTILGGVIGAAVGSQFGKGDGKLAAVGVGTLIGALIGADIGRSMDAADRAYAAGAMNQALETAPTCTTITWENPDTGHYGSVTPTETFEASPGRYCREFQQQVVIGGKLQDAYGTACRQPDGSWEIVAEQP